MTCEQIDKMTPGQLNDACAEKVKKWRKTDYKDATLPFPEYFYWADVKGNPTGYDRDFSPATRIEEAWEVCEEVAKNTRQGFSLVHYLKFYPPLVTMRERVAAKCICRAALKTVVKEAK